MSTQPPGNSKTFSLGGPYDLLGKLYSDLQDLTMTPSYNSSLRAYRAINCFLTLWHMTDWFWVALRNDKYAFQQWRTRYPKLKEKKDLHIWLCQQSPAMRVAQQIATASKHVHVNQNDPGIIAEIEYEPGNSDKFRVPRDILIRIDGKPISVEAVVDSGREFWRSFLDQTLSEDFFFPGDTPPAFLLRAGSARVFIAGGRTQVLST
jgi:hypothetical protein